MNTDPLIGRILEGRYEIQGRLADDGIYAVYAAEHLLLKRQVVLKMLPREHMTAEKIVEFQRAAQADPATLDFGETADGLLYLAVEPLVGMVLAGVYNIQKRLTDDGVYVVYDAEHVALKRRVLVKTLLPRYMADAEKIREFTQAATAAARVDPAVITFDQTADGLRYLVTEPPR